MFAELRARLKALNEVIEQHMKGDGFPFEKGVQSALDGMHGTVQALDNRVHALEVAAGTKEHGSKSASDEAELAEAAAHAAATSTDVEVHGNALHTEDHGKGEAGAQPHEHQEAAGKPDAPASA